MAQTSLLELLIATHNRGKVREIEDALKELPLKPRYLHEFPHVPSIEESGSSYAQNASIKAKFYSDETGLCSLADDSGLEVEALGGAPGLKSARFAGAGATDEERTRLLLLELNKTNDRNRRARFVCVVAIVIGGSTNILTGTCKGKIADAPRGTNGFGFDPIFIPDGLESTFAELPTDVKSSMSHRGKALASAREYLFSWLHQDRLGVVS